MFAQGNQPTRPGSKVSFCPYVSKHHTGMGILFLLGGRYQDGLKGYGSSILTHAFKKGLV